jgi:hypothetical protein
MNNNVNRYPPCFKFTTEIFDLASLKLNVQQRKTLILEHQVEIPQNS